MVHIFRRDELMLGEDRRRRGPSRQNVQREPDRARPVLLGKIRHGADQPRAWLAQLLATVRFAVVPKDGTLPGAARLLEPAQSAQSARIGCGPHQNALRFGCSEVLSNALQRSL